MGSGSKHELALSVGVVDLARQQGGQLVGPASGFIEEALTITSAVATVRRSTNQQKKQRIQTTTTKSAHVHKQTTHGKKKKKQRHKKKKKKKERISVR